MSWKVKVKDVINDEKLTKIVHLLCFNVTGIDSHTSQLLQVMSLDNFKQLVRTELETYDADKTGRTDFALENSGSKIHILFWISCYVADFWSIELL